MSDFSGDAFNNRLFRLTHCLKWVTNSSQPGFSLFDEWFFFVFWAHSTRQTRTTLILNTEIFIFFSSSFCVRNPPTTMRARAPQPNEDVKAIFYLLKVVGFQHFIADSYYFFYARVALLFLCFFSSDLLQLIFMFITIIWRTLLYECVGVLWAHLVTVFSVSFLLFKSDLRWLTTLRLTHLSFFLFL